MSFHFQERLKTLSFNIIKDKSFFLSDLL